MDNEIFGYILSSFGFKVETDVRKSSLATAHECCDNSVGGACVMSSDAPSSSDADNAKQRGVATPAPLLCR
jgi:hypothetical protein